MTKPESGRSARNWAPYDSIREISNSEEAEDPKRPRPKGSQEGTVCAGALRTRLRCVVRAHAHAIAEEQNIDRD